MYTFASEYLGTRFSKRFCTQYFMITFRGDGWWTRVTIGYHLEFARHACEKNDDIYFYLICCIFFFSTRVCSLFFVLNSVWLISSKISISSFLMSLETIEMASYTIFLFFYLTFSCIKFSATKNNFFSRKYIFWFVNPSSQDKFFYSLAPCNYFLLSDKKDLLIFPFILIL